MHWTYLSFDLSESPNSLSRNFIVPGCPSREARTKGFENSFMPWIVLASVRETRFNHFTRHTYSELIGSSQSCAALGAVTRSSRGRRSIRTSRIIFADCVILPIPTNPRLLRYAANMSPSLKPSIASRYLAPPSCGNKAQFCIVIPVTGFVFPYVVVI